MKIDETVKKKIQRNLRKQNIYLGENNVGIATYIRCTIDNLKINRM